MERELAKRYEVMRTAQLTWDPVKGGREAIICFKDSLTSYFVGKANPILFDQISQRMMGGNYYPEDAVQFFGLFLDESRALRPGDRVLQRAPLIGGLCAWSMVEIYVAERREMFCRIGYVTTKRHHGRGIWTATLYVEEDELALKVESIASPRSFLFWLGLPVARYLQLRARRRAIEEFTKLAATLQTS